MYNSHNKLRNIYITGTLGTFVFVTVSDFQYGRRSGYYGYPSAKTTIQHAVLSLSWPVVAPQMFIYWLFND